MKLIGLAGAKSSGKSTVRSYLVRTYNCTPLRFAEPLKNMFRAFLADLLYTPDAQEIERYVEGDLKEAELPGLGVTAREFMQLLGTEFGRDTIHEDLWVKIQERRVKHMLTAEQTPVFEDVRFYNERSMIKRHGGKIIRIDRPGLKSEDTHVSEQTIPADFVVVNDGSIEELERKIMRIVDSAV